MRFNWRMLLAAIAALGLFATACSDGDDGAGAPVDGADAAADTTTDAADDTTTDAADDTTADPAGDAADMSSLSGDIAIAGSSTVLPLTTAVAEEFSAVAPDVIVDIASTGTGGGFERFCAEGSTQISNASRPINEEEAAACADNGIEFTEVRVGTDALTMVTSPDTEFLDCLTTDQLVTLWGPDGATTWDQVNPEFPAEQVQIFAPDTDSGTYDFFNETILEPAGIEVPRQDYQASADDNIISQGVQATPGSWGYFGFAYFQNNAQGLKPVAYDAGDGCVEPSVETAQDGSYGLTRPLFIYVRNDALAEPHVAGFVQYYLDNVGELIELVGYVPAPQETIDEARAAVEANL